MPAKIQNENPKSSVFKLKLSFCHFQLQAAEFRNAELQQEHELLKTQLLQSSDSNEVYRLKIDSLNQQLDDIKSWVDVLTEENLQHHQNIESKTTRIQELESKLDNTERAMIGGSEEIVNSLKGDISELQTRLKKKTECYDALIIENQKYSEHSAKQIQQLQQKLEENFKKYEETSVELNSVKDQLEKLSYKYDELLMSSNLKEMEIEKMDGLKSENEKLKSRLSIGQSDGNVCKDRDTNQLNLSDIIESPTQVNIHVC